MTAPITRQKRKFVSEELDIQEWSDVQPYFDQLLNIEINSVQDLEDWMKKRSELESVIGEDYRWRYVDQSCDTNHAEKEAALNNFIKDIMPHWLQVSNE